MRNLKIIVALSLFFTINSWALWGIGGHWSPSTSSLKSSEGSVYSSGDFDLSINQNGINNFYGFGVKAWIDLAKYVNFEVTANVNTNSYDSEILITGPSDISKSIPIELAFDAPLIPSAEAKPIFSSVITDLTYYITVVNVDLKVIELNFNAGGGISYFYTTPVIGAEFTEEFLNGSGKELADDLINNPEMLEDPDALVNFAKEIGEALADEGMNHGVGGHAMLGARLDMPIVDIYANAKYYFGGGADEQYQNGFIFELGGGIGF